MPLSSYLDRQENQDPRISNDTRQQATKTLRNSKTGLPGDLGRSLTYYLQPHAITCKWEWWDKPVS